MADYFPQTLMLLIKQFTVGDPSPDDAKMLGMVPHIDYKAQRRHVTFYFAVPEHRRKKCSRSPRA